MHALLHAALVKLLVHSIRQGHVEGIRLAIEKAVDVRYVDKKGRNLLQYASFWTLEMSLGLRSVGSITLDAEILHRPSVYRIYYEQHVATPLPLPPHALRALEHTLCVKDLDSGRTVSVQAANDVVLSALKSMRSTHADVVLSPESAAQELCVPLGGNAAHPDDGVEWSGVHDVDSNIESSASSVEFPGPDACEQGMMGGICGADDAVSGSYRCVAMLTISVVMRNPRQTKPRVEAELSLQSTSHYNITVSYTGHIGLTLEGLPMDATTHKFRLVVVDVTDAFAQLYPQVQVGDRLVALNDNNTEYAGLKHTVWELKDARRPLVLQFQRSSPHDKVARRTGLVARLRHGPAPVLAA
ncbi:hypothetical protein DYB32_007181 [Aphanomyces invadans]|uniref:PDZ domain-containing protein n=1 Tax=Aphanomyces invadans TaxID=157072 RepID=A0A3R6WJ51_9STRA|nr:hypothetical protein DYB32_007181 [Aphanomyces invadans]